MGSKFFIKRRRPLQCKARQKAIEIVEADALAGRPSRERSHGGGLGRGRVVPFAEGGGLVAIFAEHFGERRGCFSGSRPCSRPNRRRARRWFQTRRADDCVPRQQRGPRR